MSGFNIIDDGHGNLILPFSVIDDGHGNLIVSGNFRASDIGSGNIILHPTEAAVLPFLFPSDYDFSLPTNGHGPLTDAISCLATSEINGSYELELKYPVTGVHYAELVARAIIMAQREKDGDPQPYRIYRISKPINGIVTVYARHIVQTDLAGIPVMSFAADNVVDAMTRINQAAVYPTHFTFSTTKTTVASMEVSKPTPILSLLGGMRGSILDTYGGEYEYNVFSVRLLDRLGTDNGVKIAYGKNLTSLEQEENVADCYSGAVGYWTDGENTVTTAVRPAPGTYDYTRIATVDLSDRFDAAPTQAQLQAALDSYMSRNQIGVPKVSLRLSFVDLSDTVEYAGIAQSVALGDTVHVSFPALGVTADARVVKTVWNVLLDRYESLEIGSVRASIADTIAAQQSKIATLPTRQQTAAQASSIASIIAASITGNRGGYVVLHDSNGDGEPDEILIMDTNSIITATNVWRWNQLGLMHSSDGYSGTWTNAAITADGKIAAEFITAANIVSGFIQNAAGNFKIDLDGNALSVTGSKTYNRANYSQSDLTRIQNIMLGTVTPTDEDFEKYDIFGDGEISGVDLNNVVALVNGTYNTIRVDWFLGIEPQLKSSALHVYRKVYRDGVLSSTVTTLEVGAGDLRTDTLRARQIIADGLLVGGQSFPSIQTGTATGNASNWTTVSFQQEFPEAPKVYACWATTGSNKIGAWGAIKVSDITASGFRVNVAGSAPTSAEPIDWIAIY